jgi:hypothetical protein
MGSETFADPLRPGSKIAAATEWPAIPFTHQSLEPTAPGVAAFTQDGLYELVWTIPMRLWVQKAPIDQVRRMLLPFYDRYLAAFVPDKTLGGLCQTSHINRFGIANAGDWAWLEVDLQVIELVSYI